MRRVKIPKEAIDMLLRPRGEYHVSLALMYNVNKILFPERITDLYLAGLKYECAQAKNGKIYLTEKEYEFLNAKISRNGKTLADVMELTGKIHKNPADDEQGYAYIEYNYKDDNYRKACALYLCHKHVTNIEFIETTKGEIYICCRINRIPQEAVRIKRTQSRNLDVYEEDIHYKYAALYYYNKLIKYIKD